MYNKVFIIGNLTRDPELRYTTSGIPVCRFTVAVNRFKRKEESQEAAGHDSSSANQDVDFINIVAWRRTAEIVGEYLKKGRPVAVEGRLQVSNFVGRDGEKRSMVEVIADNIQMLGKREEGDKGPVKAHEGNEGGKGPVMAHEGDESKEVDEIPF